MCFSAKKEPCKGLKQAGPLKGRYAAPCVMAHRAANFMTDHYKFNVIVMIVKYIVKMHLELISPLFKFVSYSPETMHVPAFFSS